MQKFKSKSEIKLRTILTFLLSLSFFNSHFHILLPLLSFLSFFGFSLTYLLPFHSFYILIVPSVPVSVLAPLSFVLIACFPCSIPFLFLLPRCFHAFLTPPLLSIPLIFQLIFSYFLYSGLYFSLFLTLIFCIGSLLLV